MFSREPRLFALLPPKLPSLVEPGSPLKKMAAESLPLEPVFEIVPLLLMSIESIPVKVERTPGPTALELDGDMLPRRLSMPIAGPPTLVIVPEFKQS